MTEIKQLPEQTPLHKDYELSKEFREFIDRTPAYAGTVLEDKQNVLVDYLGSYGFQQKLLLPIFLRGVLYARAIDKTTTIRFPEGMGSEIEEKLNTIFNEAHNFIAQTPYEGSSKNLIERLLCDDATK